MSVAMDILREDQTIYTIILTGEGDKAFCSGGDQNVKGKGGYIGKDGVPRLNVLDVQRKIRSMPKPVIAMVNGFAIGGGHVLHVVCDLTIASDNAIFGQTGPKVGSFDAGLGSSYLAAIVVSSLLSLTFGRMARPSPTSYDCLMAVSFRATFPSVPSAAYV